MERRLKILACTALGLVVFQGNAHAADRAFVERPMYYGASAELNFMSLKDDYKNLYNDRYPGTDVLLGWRFNERYGMDFGYSWSMRKTKTNNFANGAVFSGTAANMATSVDSTMRLKNTHLDANAYWPVYNNVDAVFSLGLGFVKQGIKNVVTPEASNLAPIFDNIESRTNAVPRLGLGVDGMFSDDWGLRAMVRYQHMGRAKLRDNGLQISQNIFKDSAIISLGLYRHFKH